MAKKQILKTKRIVQYESFPGGESDKACAFATKKQDDLINITNQHGVCGGWITVYYWEIKVT